MAIRYYLLSIRYLGSDNQLIDCYGLKFRAALLELSNSAALADVFPYCCSLSKPSFTVLAFASPITAEISSKEASLIRFTLLNSFRALFLSFLQSL